MSTKLRVGVIGVGKMGELHLQKYQDISAVEIVGFFEPDQKRARHISERYRVLAFQNISELLFEADAVSVTSTTPTHFVNCHQALDSGVHVLVEKPMCDDIDQASQLIRMAERKNLILQVGYLERFRISNLSQLVSLETVKLIEARWFATQLPREKNLDVVADMLVHPLDIVLSIFQDEPSSVHVSGFPFVTDDLDVFECRLEFPDGAVASIFVNRVAQHRERRVTLFSSKITASLNFLTNHIDLVRVVGGETERLNLESTGSNLDVLKLQLEDFVMSIKKSVSPLVSAKDGLRVLKVVKRLRSVYESKGVVPLRKRPLGSLHVS